MHCGVFHIWRVLTFGERDIWRVGNLEGLEFGEFDVWRVLKSGGLAIWRV